MRRRIHSHLQNSWVDWRGIQIGIRSQGLYSSVLFSVIAVCVKSGYFIRLSNLERIIGQQLSSIRTRHRCCLHSFALFCPFAPPTLSWGLEFFHCENSASGTEVDPRLGCRGYLLPVSSIANRLTCCVALTSQRSIDKLTIVSRSASW